MRKTENPFKHKRYQTVTVAEKTCRVAFHRRGWRDLPEESGSRDGPLLEDASEGGEGAWDPAGRLTLITFWVSVPVLFVQAKYPWDTRIWDAHRWNAFTRLRWDKKSLRVHAQV